MMTRVHLVGGQLGVMGGVSDYTSVLAGALSSRGVTTHIWDANDPGVRRQIRTELRREPAPVIVQYVPNAFGWKGANVAVCAWLLSLRREGHDVRVMFHEPYFYFSAHPLRNALALIQRVMAAMLLRAATECYVSTDNWSRYLVPYAPAGTKFLTLPIPATVGRRRDVLLERKRRAELLVGGTTCLVGHFGTFGSHVAVALAPILRQLLRERRDAAVVCVGRGADAFAGDLRRSDPSAAARIVSLSELSSEDVASVLRACDVVVQPYPDGVTARRTSIMASIANEVATVTSQGVLSEPFWSESGAVALAPAGDACAHVRQIVSLLDGESRRIGLARRAVEFYDAHCSIDVTVNALLGRSLVAA